MTSFTFVMVWLCVAVLLPLMLFIWTLDTKTRINRYVSYGCGLGKDWFYLQRQSFHMNPIKLATRGQARNHCSKERSNDTYQALTFSFSYLAESYKYSDVHSNKAARVIRTQGKVRPHKIEIKKIIFTKTSFY